MPDSELVLIFRAGFLGHSPSVCLLKNSRRAEDVEAQMGGKKKDPNGRENKGGFDFLEAMTVTQKLDCLNHRA